MICDGCKRFFRSGNMPDGTLNGVAFVLKNNKKITMCAECLMRVGRMNEKERNEFFEKLKGNVKNG